MNVCMYTYVHIECMYTYMFVYVAMCVYAVCMSVYPVAQYGCNIVYTYT